MQAQEPDARRRERMPRTWMKATRRRSDGPAHPQDAAPQRMPMHVRITLVTGLLGAASLLSADPGWAAEAGIETVKAFATRLTNYVTAIAASVAVLFMAISGVRWTMSSGNPMRQTEARNGLVRAAAGLAIALSANVIVNLVVAALR